MPLHNRRSTLIGWWVLALAIVVLDHITKLIVHTVMPYGQVIPVFEFFNLVHVWNTGAAFGFLADAGGWQRYFFIVVAVGVSLGLGIVLLKPMPLWQAAGFSLILGGALGNALDRIVRGYVVDYLDVHWRGWHWPAFNLADVGITCGAALLLVTAFAGDKVETPRERE